MRNNPKHIFFILILFILFISKKTASQGMNITGLEQTWVNHEKALEIKKYSKTLKTLKFYNVDGVRLPIDIDFFLNKADSQKKREFKRLIRKIIRNQKADTPLIFAYFNHKLNHNNYELEAKYIANNWVNLIQFLGQKKLNSHNFYVEIVNEPFIYPEEWKIAAEIIIEHIRSYYPNIKIIVGASNYNSIYELSRLEPFPYKNLIYSFHFYEPFIFTHQGTEWTGPQNSTLGIPFPYYQNRSEGLPDLSEKAIGTAGEINYRDYGKTGNYKAIEHKINIISKWKNKYDLEVWCTEYGVTKKADRISRLRYLEKVEHTLKLHDIRGFIWEYEGNFGVKDLGIYKTKF